MTGNDPTGPSTTTHHPPPAPQATAHGVDDGWNTPTMLGQQQVVPGPSSNDKQGTMEHPPPH
jgi:hypothetical protein